jgi:hypothetical protein
MRPTAPTLLVFALALAAAESAPAQIYRWVDERGVVNYANRAPSDGRQVARIDARESRVSIIPIVSRGARPAALPPLTGPAPGGFPGAVDRLTVSNVQGALAWRERCFAERRVDCANPTAATYDFGTAYAPASPSAAPPR